MIDTVLNFLNANRVQLINSAYLLAAVLFILGLRGLAHPRTAVRGNLLGSLAMLIAIVATLFTSGLGFEFIIAGLGIGAVIGLTLAVTIQMTAMPQLVAAFNGFGGIASVLVAGGLMYVSGNLMDTQTAVATAASGLIGGVTFSGSLKVTTFGAPAFWPGSGGNVVQNLPAPYLDVTAEFDLPVVRAGMDIITGPDDDVRLSAFLDDTLVESHDFATDSTPSFIGLEVTGGFDELLIHVFRPSGGTHGSFLADDFRFDLVVLIDIKPGSDPNSINCKNENKKKTIAVAILTTPDFDATTVDHATVEFEGAGEAHVDKKSGDPRRHEEDVDDDGDTDLVLHFRLGDTALTCSSTEGTLTGETFGGEAIEGTDAVRMVRG